MGDSSRMTASAKLNAIDLSILDEHAKEPLTNTYPKCFSTNDLNSKWFDICNYNLATVNQTPVLDIDKYPMSCTSKFSEFLIQFPKSQMLLVPLFDSHSNLTGGSSTPGSSSEHSRSVGTPASLAVPKLVIVDKTVVYYPNIHFEEAYGNELRIQPNTINLEHLFQPCIEPVTYSYDMKFFVMADDSKIAQSDFIHMTMHRFHVKDNLLTNVISAAEGSLLTLEIDPFIRRMYQQKPPVLDNFLYAVDNQIKEATYFAFRYQSDLPFNMLPGKTCWLSKTPNKRSELESQLWYCSEPYTWETIENWELSNIYLGKIFIHMNRANQYLDVLVMALIHGKRYFYHGFEKHHPDAIHSNFIELYERLIKTKHDEEFVAVNSIITQRLANHFKTFIHIHSYDSTTKMSKHHLVCPELPTLELVSHIPIGCDYIHLLCIDNAYFHFVDVRLYSIREFDEAIWLTKLVQKTKVISYAGGVMRAGTRHFHPNSYINSLADLHTYITSVHNETARVGDIQDHADLVELMTVGNFMFRTDPTIRGRRDARFLDTEFEFRLQDLVDEPHYDGNLFRLFEQQVHRAKKLQFDNVKFSEFNDLLTLVLSIKGGELKVLTSLNPIRFSIDNEEERKFKRQYHQVSLRQLNYVKTIPTTVELAPRREYSNVGRPFQLPISTPWYGNNNESPEAHKRYFREHAPLTSVVTVYPAEDFLDVHFDYLFFTHLFPRDFTKFASSDAKKRRFRKVESIPVFVRHIAVGNGNSEEDSSTVLVVQANHSPFYVSNIYVSHAYFQTNNDAIYLYEVNFEEAHRRTYANPTTQDLETFFQYENTLFPQQITGLLAPMGDALLGLGIKTSVKDALTASASSSSKFDKVTVAEYRKRYLTGTVLPDSKQVEEWSMSEDTTDGIDELRLIEDRKQALDAKTTRGVDDENEYKLLLAAEIEVRTERERLADEARKKREQARKRREKEKARKEEILQELTEKKRKAIEEAQRLAAEKLKNAEELERVKDELERVNVERETLELQRQLREDKAKDDAEELRRLEERANLAVDPDEAAELRNSMLDLETTLQQESMRLENNGDASSDVIDEGDLEIQLKALQDEAKQLEVQKQSLSNLESVVLNEAIRLDIEKTKVQDDNTNTTATLTGSSLSSTSQKSKNSISDAAAKKAKEAADQAAADAAKKAKEAADQAAADAAKKAKEAEDQAAADAAKKAKEAEEAADAAKKAKEAEEAADAAKKAKEAEEAADAAKKAKEAEEAADAAKKAKEAEDQAAADAAKKAKETAEKEKVAAEKAEAEKVAQEVLAKAVVEVEVAEKALQETEVAAQAAADIVAASANETPETQAVAANAAAEAAAKVQAAQEAVAKARATQETAAAQAAAAKTETEAAKARIDFDPVLEQSKKDRGEQYRVLDLDTGHITVMPAITSQLQLYDHRERLRELQTRLRSQMAANDHFRTIANKIMQKLEIIKAILEKEQTSSKKQLEEQLFAYRQTLYDNVDNFIFAKKNYATFENEELEIKLAVYARAMESDSTEMPVEMPVEEKSVNRRINIEAAMDQAETHGKVAARTLVKMNDFRTANYMVVGGQLDTLENEVITSVVQSTNFLYYLQEADSQVSKDYIEELNLRLRQSVAALDASVVEHVTDPPNYQRYSRKYKIYSSVYNVDTPYQSQPSTTPLSSEPQPPLTPSTSAASPPKKPKYILLDKPLHFKEKVPLTEVPTKEEPGPPPPDGARYSSAGDQDCVNGIQRDVLAALLPNLKFQYPAAGYLQIINLIQQIEHRKEYYKRNYNPYYIDIVHRDLFIERLESFQREPEKITELIMGYYIIKYLNIFFACYGHFPQVARAITSHVLFDIHSDTNVWPFFYDFWFVGNLSIIPTEMTPVKPSMIVSKAHIQREEIDQIAKLKRKIFFYHRHTDSAKNERGDPIRLPNVMGEEFITELTEYLKLSLSKFTYQMLPEMHKDELVCCAPYVIQTMRRVHSILAILKGGYRTKEDEDEDHGHSSDTAHRS